MQPRYRNATATLSPRSSCSAATQQSRSSHTAAIQQLLRCSGLHWVSSIRWWSLCRHVHEPKWRALVLTRKLIRKYSCLRAVALVSASPCKRQFSAFGVGVVTTHVNGEPGSGSPSSDMAIVYFPTAWWLVDNGVGAIIVVGDFRASSRALRIAPDRHEKCIATLLLPCASVVNGLDGEAGWLHDGTLTQPGACDLAQSCNCRPSLHEGSSSLRRRRRRRHCHGARRLGRHRLRAAVHGVQAPISGPPAIRFISSIFTLLTLCCYKRCLLL